LGYVAEEAIPRRTKTVFAIILILLLVLVSFTVIGLIDNSRFYFEKEGDTSSYRLSNLTKKPEQGRTVYELALGRFTPDKGVRVSFYTYALNYDYEVDIITSEGEVLFRDIKNTGTLTTVFPDRVGNLTLTITPYCTSCSFDGYEGGTYTYYSAEPYFEFKIASFWLGSVVLAVGFEWLYLRMRGRPMRHLVYLTTLTVICLGLIFLSWYMHAYASEVWYVPTLFGLLTIVAGELLTRLRPNNPPPSVTPFQPPP
jgi:hypothetical protein